MAVRAGVPQALRCAVWTTCSGATGKKTKVASELGQEADKLYPSFVSHGLNLRNEASGVIDVDVPRTGCVEALLEPLRRVLLAFAAKNPQIGYCQSMNFIVATLLECCDEESAFWILCSLVEDMLPENYYTRNMIGVRVDMMVLNSLVLRHLPSLHAHFLEHEVDLSPVTMGWFLCLYVNTLPNPSLHRVLDSLLHEGSKVLFRTALAILHGLEAELLNAQSLAKVYEVLRCPAQACPEAELLRTMYGSWLNCLSMDSVVGLRSQHLKDVLEQAGGRKIRPTLSTLHKLAIMCPPAPSPSLPRMPWWRPGAQSCGHAARATAQAQAGQGNSCEALFDARESVLPVQVWWCRSILVAMNPCHP